jgi:thiol-disulfide isomerase/thioredoxin
MKKRFILVLSIIFVLTFSFFYFPHSFESYAAEDKKLVLLELFTAEWCPPCGRANPEIDSLYEESGGKDFLLIKFHVSDDMVCKISEERARKYGASSIPTLVVNGKDSIIGYVDNYKSNLKSLIQKAKGKKTDVSIEVSGKIIGNKVQMEASFSGAPSQAQLVVVLVEDYYYYKASNGEIFHRFLARDGSTKSINASGKETFSFDINNMWAKEMLRCVAFIEDSQGVYNSAYTNFDLGEPDLKKPVISVVPNEVSLGQVKEDKKIASEILATNAGKESATLKLESKEPYLAFSESGFTVSPKSQSRMKFTLDTTNLPPKLYTSKINVTDSKNYSKEIPINFEILPKPSLSVSETSLDFGKVKRGEKPRLSFEIKNNSKGAIEGTISTNAKWLIISKKTFNDEKVNVSITAVTKDLPQGKSEAKININSDGGDAEIEVTIEIVAPNLEFDPPELNFGKVEINGESLSREVLVKNSGDIDTDVSISSLPDFCGVNEKSFSLSSGESKKIDISIVKDKLKMNTLNEGIISFTFSDEKKELKVSINPIPAPPVLSLASKYINEDKISISVKKGEDSKVEIEIKNSGAGTLEGKLEIEPKVNWASLSMNNFSLKKNESKKAIINFDSQNTPSGKHEAKLKFSSNGGNREIQLNFEVIREKITIELKIGSNSALVSGKKITVDPPPYIKNGVTLVPLRFISEAFGAEVNWEPNVGKGTVVIKLESKVIQIEIGNITAFVDGVPYKLLVPPEIKNGRTFVPLRFISEAFGAEVNWIASEQKIIIVF